MRTPRPFLGIFALALLLPLLLLACGGSDEPANGPSSERPTAGPTTEVAEPSPTPRATDEPESRISSGQTTAEPTSLETDREALVVLYNATGGPNWRRNNNWLSDVPISEWEGVTTDGNGSPETDREALDLATDGSNWHNNSNWLSDVPRYRRSWAGVTTDDNGRVTKLALGISVPQRERVERGDTAGVGQPRQPDISVPQRERVERGDTAGVGQPRQPDKAGPQRERVERGDTAGVGQPRQPDKAGPQREPVERVRAKQFVGPVEYAIFRLGWTPVLPVRPRLAAGSTSRANEGVVLATPPTTGVHPKRDIDAPQYRRIRS